MQRETKGKFEAPVTKESVNILQRYEIKFTAYRNVGDLKRLNS